MEFYNLNREVEKLSTCNSLDIEVALDAMIALITDLRNIHDVKFADGSFGKPSDLNTKLSRLANELIRVYDAKKDSFQQIPRDYFPPDIRKIERETLDVQKRLLDQEDELEKYERTKTQLQEKLKLEQRNLNALQEQQDHIQSLTDKLDEAIAQAKAIDLPALEKQKAALEQEKSSIAQKESQLLAEIGTLNTDLSLVRSNCGCSEQECARLSGELEQCRKKLAAAEELRSNLESQLSDAETRETAAGTRSGELSRLIGESASRLEVLNGQINGKSAELENTQTEIASRELACSDLSGKLTHAEAALSAIEQRISATEQNILTVTASVKGAEADLADKQQTHQTLLDDLSSLNQRIVNEENAIGQLNADIQTANSDLAGKTELRTQLQLSLDAAAAEESDLSAQAAAAIAKEQELKGKIAEHKLVLRNLADVDIEIISAGDALAQAQEDLHTASDKLRRTNEEIVSIEENTGALERDIAQQEQLLRDAEDIRLARRNERDRLITRLAEAQTETQTLQTHSNELTIQLERTNATAEELRSSIKKVNADIEAAKAAHEDLTAEFYVLNKELDYQNSRNEEYRADPLQTTAETLAAARLTYDGLLAKHGDLTDQLKAVEEERKKIDRKISTTSTFLRKCQDELDESTRLLEAKEAELQNRQDELETLQQKHFKNADDLKDVLQEIEEVTKALDDWDPVGTRAKYERKKAELTERLAGVKAMRKKLEEDTAQLEALRTEVGEQRQRQAAIREEYSLLSEEFSRLRDPKTTEQIDHYSASISVMEEVRRRIKASAGYLPDAPDLPGEVPAALQTDLDAAGSALKTLRSGIDQYLDIYSRHTAAEQS